MKNALVVKTQKKQGQLARALNRLKERFENMQSYIRDLKQQKKEVAVLFQHETYQGGPAGELANQFDLKLRYTKNIEKLSEEIDSCTQTLTDIEVQMTQLKNELAAATKLVDHLNED